MGRTWKQPQVFVSTIDHRPSTIEQGRGIPALLLFGLLCVALACSTNNGPSIQTDVPDGKAGDQSGDGRSEVCTPACEGKECGPDGCGGECGLCVGLIEQCSQEGKCEPFPCKSSKDCPGNLVCADELGQCVGCVGHEDCPEGTLCGADYACHQEHPCDSDKDCKQFDLVCDKEAGQCVQCLKAEHCAESEYCKDGFCIETLCLPSESKCEGADVLVCAADGSGWAVSLTCLENQYCEAGECKDYACKPSEVSCDGDVYKVCSDDGKSIHYEEDCAANDEHCFNGQCLPTVCEPGAKFCSDPATAATCLGDGMDFSKLPCGAAQYCDGGKGECVAQVCSPGKAECAGTVAKTCNAIGSAYASQVDCKVQGKVCVNGQCLDLACPPSTNFCVDSVTVGYCDEEGKTFLPEACKPQHSCKDGACKPWVCTPNLPVCNGQTATKCDALGLAPLPGGTPCNPPAQSCVDGKCVDCQKNCAGKECGDDGCGGSCGTCTGEDVCKAGTCAPPGMDCNNDGMDDGCPDLAGYVRTCNPQQHCEYANADVTGWKKWDVWIWIPPGSFMMGSPDNEEGHEANEAPVHQVTFAKGYFIGKYEVVVEQYEACMVDGKCPVPCAKDWDAGGWGVNSLANGRAEHPQNGVTDFAAEDFCKWVAEGGRLPSEAEWEYAATGPAHRKYPWGDTPEPTCWNQTAVFDPDPVGGMPWSCDPCYTLGCSGTKPVGTMLAGAAWSGALDMSGNVSEWVADFWHSDYGGAPADGSVWKAQDNWARCVRSGSFAAPSESIRSADRSGHNTMLCAAHLGTRCARDLP